QLGDVNGDGQINVGDLVVLTRIVLGLHTPTSGETTRGDMNQDTQLNAADILLLQKLLLSQALNQLWPDNPTNETQATRVASTAPHIRMLTQQQHWFETLFKTAEAVPSAQGELYYVHNDHLGTPQTLTNEAGTVVWSAEYDPFGKATINNDPDNDGNSVTYNKRFSGQYEDQETGLHYNYFRYYDPSIGRYLTSDPLGQLAGSNLYAYVGGNPLKYTDPFGLLNWLEKKLVTDKQINNTKDIVNNISDGSFTEKQLDNITDKVLDALTTGDAFRILDLVNNPPLPGETLNIDTAQDKAITDTFKELLRDNPNDEVIKKLLEEFEEAKRTGRCIVK
ncbi:MAG: RHS repeat-associated core domain-containing protein, partial [Thiotrichaceae bacterium]